MTSNTSAEIAVTWGNIQGFPRIDSSYISRPHHLRTITEVLTNESPVLFLEGDSGDGASTTLAQFCTENPGKTFSIFIQPASRISYSIDYLRMALADQFHWFLYGEPLRQDLLTPSEYMALQLKVVRKIRSETYFFVLDGAHQIPAEDSFVIESIFRDLLPIGTPGCRFIITGTQLEFGKFLGSKIRSRYYQLIRFSSEEAKTFLLGAPISNSDHSRIYELCKNGSPGRLAVVKRLIQSGTSLNDILEMDPGKYLEFVKLEFQSLTVLTPQEKFAIAILAFAKISHTSVDISEMSTLSLEKISLIIESSPFLKTSDSGLTEFISETHRLYASKQLETFKTDALEAQLKQFQKNPHSELSLRFMPAYLEVLNKQDAIIELLSKDYFSELLQKTESFASLRAQAEMGEKSAQALKRTHDIFKFSMQKSVFISAAEADGTPERVKALVALGQSDAALLIANGESTKEVRLKLLSAYARGLAEKNVSIDSSLKNLIEELIDQIDFSKLGDKALEIAADILIFDPDAAIGIIDKALKGEAEAVKDAAYTSLSLTTSFANIKRTQKIEDKARQKISDKAYQQIAASFAVLASKVSAKELPALLEPMPAAHQIYLIRSYVQIKRNTDDILDIVELGLDTIIKNTEYLPRAKDLAELSAPFRRKFEQHEKLRTIIKRIDGQVALVGKASNTRDLIALQMNLAAGEYQFNKKDAAQRFSQAYYVIAETKTPEVKLECLAMMMGALNRLDQDGELERTEGFRDVIRGDLSELIELMLLETADQDESLSAVLKVLAAEDSTAAVELAGRLNTLIRRDRAYQQTINTLLSRAFSETRLDAVKACIEKISTRELKASTISGSIDFLNGSAGKQDWVKHLGFLRHHLITCSQISEWDCWMLKSNKEDGLSLEPEIFEGQIKDAVKRTNSPTEEACAYFRAAEALAATDVKKAQHLYNLGSEIYRSTPYSNSGALYLIELCLSLVSRAIAASVKSSNFDEDYFLRYCSLISHIPGTIPQIRLFNEFSERMWCASREDIANRIVREKIRPLLERTRTEDSGKFKSAVRLAFPSVAAASFSMAQPLLQELSAAEASDALTDAAMLRIRHLSTQEPDSDGKYDVSKLDSGDISEIISMLQVFQTDYGISLIIKELTHTISHKSNKTRFSGTQKADWAAKLLTIISSQLPDSKNITHDGYSIVCTAHAYRLVDRPWGDWDKLEKLTADIPNRADRGYIYGVLAESLPSKFASLHRKRLLNASLEEIKKIPSQLDRLSHLQIYAQHANASDAVASARDCITLAMKLAIELDDHAKTALHRRELIDLAAQIDENFADEIVLMVDDDPARQQMKAQAKRTVAAGRERRLMANAKTVADIRKCDSDLLPVAAWKNLGALEAGRLEVKPLEILSEYLSIASLGNMHNAYPILAWHIANLERKYISAADGRSHITPLCEALLTTSELAHSIMNSIAASSKGQAKTHHDDTLVRRDSREDAIAYISTWILENATDHLIYCDPYFSTKDIELLRICLAQVPSCKISIIASKPHLSNIRQLDGDIFSAAWYEQCDQNPPETEIIAPAFIDQPAKHVIHDRWLLTKDSALRFGTSFNSLGIDKLSEISVVDPLQTSSLHSQLSKYLRRERFVDEIKLHYSSFTM